MTLIGSGAEAEIYLDGNIVEKRRVPKTYRISSIDDSLRKSRTKREFKIISKLYDAGLNVPEPIRLEKFNLFIGFLDGLKLRDVFEDDYLNYSTMIGKFIADIHNLDIVHGDLTTSNMIISNGNLYLIDFGLSKVSKRIEDKAVDLHLLKQALESYHYSVFDDSFNKIISVYSDICIDSDEVLTRFDLVEKRGRNKH